MKIQKIRITYLIYLSGVILALIPCTSCNKVKDYFRNPDPAPLQETIHMTVMMGYSADIAFALMDGQSFPNVNFHRSNPGFPCTTLMNIDADSDPGLYLSHLKATTITIAGLWADSSTAIFSVLLTGFNTGTSTISLLGIKTIPVIRKEDHITVVMASMDIQLNPDQDALLSLNLNTLEIESELFRLDAPQPGDVYVAVLEDAYFIDVYNNLTVDNITDDKYTVTGGGQLIKVAGSDAEITQQAMVEVKISPDCTLNPVDGMALMKVTGLEDQGFPELGTAVFEFTAGCGGTTRIYAATGMYVGSNGKSIPFHL